jgi:hypothetical protein
MTVTQDPHKEELARKINEAASVNFKNPVWLDEVAQLITDGVYQGFRSNDFQSVMTETVQLPLDGRYKFEEARGLRAFWHARGGYIEESDMWKDTYEILPDTIGFRFRQSHDRLRSNFAETAATLVSLGGQRMTAEINKRVIQTFQAAAGIGDPSYVGVSGISLANVNSALAAVRDASENSRPVIAGRSTMTEKLVDQLTVGNTYPLFTPETNQDLLNTGRLGVYRGAQVITLPNYVDAYGSNPIAANELYVIDPSAGRTIYFGATESINNNDLDDWYWNYVVRQDINVIVAYENRFRRIVDSTVPA